MLAGKSPGGEPELAGLLRKLGYTVTELDDSSQIQDNLVHKEYRLAVLSAAIPGMSLHGSLRSVKKVAPNMAAMVVTRTG